MIRARQEHGFLLLEMLVALSVIAVMGALMSSFLSQLGAVNRLESEIVAQTELDAAAAYLKRTLSGARPVRMLDIKPEENYQFDGDETSVRFASVTRRGFYSLALRDVHIYTVNNSDGTSLTHTLGPRRLKDGKPLPHGRPIRIVDAIDSISFAYSDGSAWTGDWDKEGELPKAVRISISRKIGGKTVSAESVASIY